MDPSSRKRLIPFMKRMIGRCPGVVWHDQDEGSFRIPWRHFHNRDWKEEDSKIFKEWAKATGKYKEGDTCDWPAWKTQLRCALNKIPDVEPVPAEFQTDSPNPYRVYRFVSTSSKRTAQSRKASGDSEGSPVTSPGSVIDESRGNTSPMEQLDKILEQTLGGENHPKLDPQQPDLFQLTYSQQVPTVVTEVSEEWTGKRELVDLSNANYILPIPGQNVQTVLNINFDIAGNIHLVEGACSPTPTTYHDPSDQFIQHVNVIPVVTENSDMSNLMNTNESENLHQQGRHETTGSDEPRFPSDLKNIDSDNLCHMETSLLMENTSIPSSFGEYLNEMSFKVFYGVKRQNEALVGRLTQKGCRLYFSRLGSNFWDNTMLTKEEVFGPPGAEQVELPSTTSFQTIEERQQNKLNQVLDNMERGLVLTIQGKDIYAERLCKTRVFATDGVSYSTVIERPSEQAGQCRPMKVFDFKEQVEKKMPAMILTFGQEIKIGHKEPMKRVLLSMELDYCIPAVLLEESMSLSSTNSCTLISHDDKNDNLITRFKDMTMAKPQLADP